MAQGRNNIEDEDENEDENENEDEEDKKPAERSERPMAQFGEHPIVFECNSAGRWAILSSP